MTDVKIVVPCYNEEQRLDVDAFMGFDIPAHHVQFLFVDDGSTDGTGKVIDSMAAEWPERACAMHLKRNQGKAEAVRQGILAALRHAPDYVGYWDADLATPLEEMAVFCDFLGERPDIEVVLGSRVRLLGRTIQRRALRHYVGRVFATGASLVLGLGVYDTQCGAKLFRVTAHLAELFRRPFLTRWVFDVEILARLTEQKRRADLPGADQVVAELPLQSWHDRPGSKLHWWHFLVAARDLLLIHRRHARRRCLRS